MAARLTRAKKKIAAARIPYAVPAPEDLPARVDAVLTVIHLLYATGHAAHSGADLVRDDLTGRALDLARMLRLLLPGEREAAGLLALLLVHEARRATRTDPEGAAAATRRAGPLGVGPRADRRGRRAARRDAAGRSAGALHRCRRRSRRCTRRRRASRRPTGRRSWRSTTSCCGSGPRRWSRSTAPWRWRWSTGRRRRWRRSRRSSATAAWPRYRYLPAHEGRAAAPARPRRRGGGRLPRGARADRQRGRAALPRVAAVGALGADRARDASRRRAPPAAARRPGGRSRRRATARARRGPCCRGGAASPSRPCGAAP